MREKWIVLGITGAIITGGLVFTTTSVARLAEANLSTGVSAVKAPAEQTQRKEVVDRLHRSWEKGIEKLLKNQVSTFKQNEWELIYGFDIDINFTSSLPRVEAQSFHMALDEVKKNYAKGDSQYGILLNKDHNSAKVLWERASGNSYHVATLVKSIDNKWSIQSHEEFQ